jgi:hypothetical protein
VPALAPGRFLAPAGRPRLRAMGLSSRRRGPLEIAPADAERLSALADRRLGADRPPPSHGPVPAPVGVPLARAVRQALG